MERLKSGVRSRVRADGDRIVKQVIGDAAAFTGVVDEDWFWYSTTARGRLMFRARVVAGFTETHPAMSALARRLLERMNRIWEPQPIATRRTHIS